jgi:hypothetical protein
MEIRLETKQMKLTKQTLKQIIKEELNKVLSENEGMAPYGKNPSELPRSGQVGEYKWKARVMTGSNTRSELEVDLEVTGPDGKTVVKNIPRIYAHAAATMLGRLSNEPDKAQKIIDGVLADGEEKAAPRADINRVGGSKKNNSQNQQQYRPGDYR